MVRICDKNGWTICNIDNQNLFVGDIIKGRERDFGMYKVIKREVYTSKLDKNDECDKDRNIDFLKYIVEEIK